MDISKETLDRVMRLKEERDANRPALPEGHVAPVLDFFKGFRYIKGWAPAELARKRQIGSTEAGRLEMIKQRELADKKGPPEVA